MANQYRVKTGVKLYTQVLEQVKSMIAQGVYKKGDLLPSEKELIEMMGVSRITVRKALQILKNVHTALPMDRFHDVLVEMVHNPLVTDWIQQSHRLETDPTLSALIPPARQRSMSPQLEAQHQKIYEAIRDHKSEHAYFYMKEHLEFVLESYQEYFAMFY